MDMEINDSSDESVNRGRRNKRPRIFSTSSDEDFDEDLAQNEGELYEENESITEEEDSESDSLSKEDDDDAEWQQIRTKSSIYNEYSEEEKFLIENVDCDDPFSLFKLFFTDYISKIIVEQTNNYAEQYINFLPNNRRHQQAWQPVTTDEINTFISILLIMGVVQLPEIRLYWSKKKPCIPTHV